MTAVIADLGDHILSMGDHLGRHHGVISESQFKTLSWMSDFVGKGQRRYD